MRKLVAAVGQRRPQHIATAADAVLQALGGAGNVSTVEHIVLTRVRIVLHVPPITENVHFLQHGIAVMRCDPPVYHVIAGKAPASLHQALSLHLPSMKPAWQCSNTFPSWF